MSNLQPGGHILHLLVSLTCLHYSFIEVQLMYNKLFRFNACSLMGGDIDHFPEAIAIISSSNIFKTVPMPLCHVSLCPPPFPRNHCFAYCESRFGFSRISCEWSHSMDAILGDAGCDFFHSGRGDLPGLLYESLFGILIVVLYNSYGRNEIGSYITCCCLKPNTNFLYVFYSQLTVTKFL